MSDVILAVEAAVVLYFLIPFAMSPPPKESAQDFLKTEIQ